METPARSLAKAVSWQIVGLIAMTGIGYAFTGSLSTGGVLAVVTTACGFVSYLVHERVWARIRWGRMPGGPSPR
jgi:uncharacterized membrane protein